MIVGLAIAWPVLILSVGYALSPLYIDRRTRRTKGRHRS